MAGKYEKIYLVWPFERTGPLSSDSDMDNMDFIRLLDQNIYKLNV